MKNSIESVVNEFMQNHATGESERILFNIWDSFMGSDEFNDMDKLQRANYLFEVRRIIELIKQLESIKQPDVVLN